MATLPSLDIQCFGCTSLNSLETCKQCSGSCQHKVIHTTNMWHSRTSWEAQEYGKKIKWVSCGPHKSYGPHINDIGLHQIDMYGCKNNQRFRHI